MGLNWEENTSIPRGPAAILSALCLSNGSAVEALRSLSEDDWAAALAFTDRSQLTLLLGQFDPSAFPEPVRVRLARNFSENCRRTERMRHAFFEIVDALDAGGIEFVSLKGFAQAPGYVPDLRFRTQYDMDLFCPAPHLPAARNAVIGLGFTPAETARRLPTDHLPTMVRWNGWCWKGNYFDQDMPLAVDLHFRFWDPDTERFDAPGVDQFWERRTTRECGGRSVPVLDPADAFAYATLHALRHCFRGSLKPFHLYEVAHFLDARADDAAFWTAWRSAHPPGLRRIEAICCRMACEWFGGRAPEAISEAMEALPEPVHRWFRDCAASPVEAMFRPNKDELWLHLSLVAGLGDRVRVMRRRILPAQLPERDRLTATRAAYHARALVPTLWRGLVWRLSAQKLGKPFWVFLGAAGLFNLGMFVFFLLYNLHLLELGYRENVLGWITSATTAGSIAGTLPAGAIIERLNVRRAMLACFAGVAALSALRSIVTSQPALLACAFAGGAVLSLWAVSIPPAVAQLTTERTRPFGFSLVFAAGIGMGVLGGLVGGWLPTLLAPFASGALSAKQVTLLAGCALMAAATIPASRLRLAAIPGRKRVKYPRSGFILRFLGALVLWGAAVGSFNSFFSAYFATQLHASAAWIGSVFSFSQLAQVAAVLGAPFVLRKLGNVRGIVAMQFATGMALAGLASGPAGWAAASIYAAYTASQYMSEPGIFSLLMNRVHEDERSGASSLNFFVGFSVQAITVACAGAAYARFGYPPVLAAAACLAVTAALLFWILLRSNREPAPDSAPE